MSSTYNAKETIYFSSHSVSCKTCLLDIFGQFQNPLIIHQIRDFHIRDSSIHMVFKTCPLYQLQPFLKQILRGRSFNNLILLVNNLKDSSITTYCSQPFEFVKTSFMTNWAFMSFFEVSFLPYNLTLIGKIK